MEPETALNKLRRANFCFLFVSCSFHRVTINARLLRPEASLCGVDFKMASKFSDFVSSKKIDRRRLLAVSKKLEALRPLDRRARLARRLSKKEGGKPVEGELAEKGRSGRPISPALIDRIEAGKAVPGAAKTRVLRAVNALLEQKKESAVSYKDLF